MVLSWLAGQTNPGQARARWSRVLPWHDPVRVAESSPCSTTSRAAGPSWAWAGGSAGSSSTASGCHGRVAAAVHGVQRGASWRRWRRATSSTTASSTSSRARRSGRGRSRASRVAPSRRRCRRQSMELMARMGVGLLVIAQKPWDTAEAELAGVPAALPGAQRLRGAEADPGHRRRREPRPRPGAADARASTSSAGPARPSSTTSSTTSASRRSRATSTTAPWPTTSPSTA